MFELIEDLTSCPPPEQINLDFEWTPYLGYVYGHKEYNVKTMTVYINKERAGYLDFVFTIDSMEEMAIQFWEMAIHPKFQGMGVFSAMIGNSRKLLKRTM